MKSEFRITSFRRQPFEDYLKERFTADILACKSPFELSRYAIPYEEDIPEEDVGHHVVYRTAKGKLSFSSQRAFDHYAEFFCKDMI